MQNRRLFYFVKRRGLPIDEKIIDMLYDEVTVPVEEDNHGWKGIHVPFDELIILEKKEDHKERSIVVNAEPQ